MSQDEKIVIPSEEEVSRYASGNRDEGSAQADRPADAGQGDAPAAAASSEEQDWRDKYLRARAELSNFQRRSEKDRAEAIRYAVADLVRALLPVLDNLDRVIDTSPGDAQKLPAIVEGARLTRDMFLKVLKEFHVTEIEAAGQPFDPAVHEAMMEQPSQEYPNRTVLQQLAKGYRLHDRVLRPSKVVVSRRENSAGDGEASKAD